MQVKDFLNGVYIMTKYHYNSETGKSGLCRAADGNCPLKGNVPHFSSLDEANKYAEKIELVNNNLFTKVAKGEGIKRIRPNPEDYGFPKDYFENISKGYADKFRNRQSNLEDDDPNKNLPYIYHKKWDSWIDWQRKNPGLALEPMPNAPKKVKIYRSGAMEPPKYDGEIAMYADEADYHRPADAAPRHGSLFASADGRGLNRWLKANGDPMANREVKDFEPIEIEVDPNKVRVYHIPSWEDVSWRGAPPQKFWDSGMLLSRFNQACAEEGWDSSEWEILVDPKDVIKSKPMSSASVTKLTNDYIDYDGDREQLKKTLKEVNNWRKNNKQL